MSDLSVYEQRAREIVDAFPGDEYWIDKKTAARAIADALQTAALAAAGRERARCAALADSTTTAPMDYRGWSPGPAADDRARKIAALIRALPDD